MSFLIRRAMETDIGAVGALRLEFLAQGRPGFVPSAEFTASTLSFLRSEHEADRAHSWIASDQATGEDIGSVTMVMWPCAPLPEDERTTQACIFNMYVRPDYQSRGIGRALLNECIGTTEELGVRSFMLHATDQGRPLYESIGFEAPRAFMQRKS